MKSTGEKAMLIKNVVGTVLYFFAKRLPVSYSRIKIGQKQLRAFAARLIVNRAGNNINIEKGAVFSRQLIIGDNSGVGVNCVINGKCTIGNDVMMGPNCQIFTINHKFSSIDIPMNCQGNSDEKPVIIGDDVWIGASVIILPGVKIGSHSVIGAGSVVARDIPDYAIAAGNPAEVKKYRNQPAEDRNNDKK